MTTYYRESARKVFKLTEDGKLYSKWKSGGRWKRIKDEDEYKIATPFLLDDWRLQYKKNLFFEMYNDRRLKDDERVVLKSGNTDYTKENLVVVKKKPTDVEYFRKPHKNVYHFNHQNKLLGKYGSQVECSLKTGYNQSEISLLIGNRKRSAKDGSYFTNDKNYRMDPMRGYNFRGSKSVVQLDRRGNVLNKFRSPKQAVDLLGLSNSAQNDISMCCRGQRVSARGFKWKSGDTRKKMDRLIAHYEDDKLMGVYRTRKEMTESTGISKSTISRYISHPRSGKRVIKELNYNDGMKLRKKFRKQRLKENI